MDESQLRRAVFELHNVLYNKDATNFSAQLYYLFFKSDPSNFTRLSLGFPAEALAIVLWREATSETEFFERFGVTTKNGDRL